MVIYSFIAVCKQDLLRCVSYLCFYLQPRRPDLLTIYHLKHSLRIFVIENVWGTGASKMAAVYLIAPTILLFFCCFLNTNFVFQHTKDTPNLMVINGNYKIQICIKLHVTSEAFVFSHWSRKNGHQLKFEFTISSYFLIFYSWVVIYLPILDHSGNFLAVYARIC